MPSLLMNYSSSYNIAAPAGTVTTWGGNCQFFPHPLCWAALGLFPTGGAVVGRNLYNPQFTGANWATRLAGLLNTVQRWRLAYYGVTVTLNAPSTASQGVITACQRPVTLSDGGSVSGYTVIAGPANAHAAIPRIRTFDADDEPAFTSCQIMPMAYTGKAIEGLYLPLKMTKDAQRWRSAADNFLFYRSAANTGGLPATAPITAGRDYPFIGLIANGDPIDSPVRYFNTDASAIHELGSASMTGGVVPDFLDRYFGDVCFQGLDVDASLTITIRCGFEVQVAPTSQFAPQLRLSPRHDPMAIDSYFAVSRELKDAYPEAYNSFDKLFGVIKTIAKTVLPVVSTIFPAAAPIAGAIGGVVDLLLPSQKTNPMDKPVPAASAQAPAIVVKEVAPAPRRRKAKPRTANRTGGQIRTRPRRGRRLG